MSDLNACRHFEHPYTRHVDEYGITVPGCACGERAIPGGRLCTDCLIAAERAKADAEAAANLARAARTADRRRFPETPLPTTGVTP